MVSVVTLANFILGVERGLIIEVFSIVVGSEKRVYGKSREGSWSEGGKFQIVYAVVS